MPTTTTSGQSVAVNKSSDKVRHYGDSARAQCHTAVLAVDRFKVKSEGGHLVASEGLRVSGGKKLCSKAAPFESGQEHDKCKREVWSAVSNHKSPGRVNERGANFSKLKSSWHNTLARPFITAFHPEYDKSG